MFDAGSFLQHFVHKAYNAAGYKEGTEITQDNNNADDDDKADAVILHMYLALLIDIGKNGYPAIDRRHYEINGIGRYSYRRKYQQALQEILQQLLKIKWLFHKRSVLVRQR
jgi:hypothetical protein